MVSLYSEKKVDSVGKKIKVLVTDAGYKHTLGAVRSLGKAGYYVIAMDSHKFAQSFFSRYCREKIISPSPKKEKEFIAFLKIYLQKNSTDVLLPIGYNSTVAISRNKNELLPFTHIPVADYETLMIAADKDKTLDFAKKLGIPIPCQYRNFNEIERFPIVIKGIFESGNIIYVNSRMDLNKIAVNNGIIQEYIPGEGFGFYALFNRGTVKAIFMHKRIREYPITGGASTCAISIFNEELMKYGLKILQSLNWHGVAMVEFKKDSRDGKFKLMEINPKFWGSLDLSIASGVDFPRLLVEMAINGDVNPVFHYSQDIKFRWPFPDDFLHFLANPKSIRDIFIESFNKNTKSNIQIDDPIPTLVQIQNTFGTVLQKLLKGKLRYPQGYPRINS